MMWHRQSFPAAGVLSSGLLLRRVQLAAEAPAAPCRILFFSDLHARHDLLKNRCSASPLREWSGLEMIGNALRDSVEELKPDVLLFGGDLVSRTVLYPAAFELLSTLSAPQKIAVFGNWEKKCRSWLPSAKVERGFRDAGFRLLINESFLWNGIQFSGVDDFRFGKPVIPEPDPRAIFRCLLSHNPDLMGKSRDPNLGKYDLALCGHTHGGQIRLPLFGAVKTSSIYWKRFEHGILSKRGKPLTVVSAGIGVTCVMTRFRCPPELLLIELNPEKS